MRRLRTWLPHRGPSWEARRGNRWLTFRPVQLIGGRRWSLMLATNIEPVPTED